MNKVNIGDTIKIIKMEGEPQYANREGVITTSTMPVKYTEPGEAVHSFPKWIRLLS